MLKKFRAKGENMHFSFVTFSVQTTSTDKGAGMVARLVVWHSGRTLWRPHSDFMDMLRHLISCRIIIIIIGL